MGRRRSARRLFSAIARFVLISLIETAAALLVLYLLERGGWYAVMVDSVDGFLIYPYETGGFLFALVLTANLGSEAVRHIVIIGESRASVRRPLPLALLSRIGRFLIMTIVETIIFVISLALLREAGLYEISVIALPLAPLSPTNEHLSIFSWLFFFSLLVYGNLVGEAVRVAVAGGPSERRVPCCDDITCMGGELPMCADMP